MASRAVAVIAFILLAAFFTVDALTPQTLVIAILFDIPILLAALTRSRRLTAALVAAAVSADAPSISFASSTTGSSTLTITATKSAANRSPRFPWKSGGPMMFCAVLLGAPLARRKGQLLAVLLTALAIAAASLLVACSGSGGNSAQSPQTYTVTVTPTGSGTVMNPAAIIVTVTVQ